MKEQSRSFVTEERDRPGGKAPRRPTRGFMRWVLVRVALVGQGDALAVARDETIALQGVHDSVDLFERSSGERVFENAVQIQQRDPLARPSDKYQGIPAVA